MKLASPLLPVLHIRNFQPVQANADKQQNFFSPGQLLQGRVTGKENNQFSLDINGKQFTINGKISLPTGTKLNLQVTSITPHITLKVVNDSLTRNINNSLHLLTGGLGPGLTLAALASRIAKDGLSKATIQTLGFFSSLLLTAETSALNNKSNNYGALHAGQHQAFPNVQELKLLFRRSGLSLEQLLIDGKKQDATHTIKSALLDIIQSSHNQNHVQQAGQLLATIDLFQILQIRFAMDSIFFQPVILPFLCGGYLLVQPDNSKDPSEEEKIKKYSLHLQLEGLGNLKIELEQQKNGIHIRFFTEDRQRTEFLADNRAELHEKFTDLQLASVQFLTGAENPTQTIMKMLSGTSSGIIDTRA